MVIYDSVTRVGRYTLFFIVGDPVIYLQFIAGEMGRFEAWECGVPDFRANLSYLSQMRWARFFFCCDKLWVAASRTYFRLAPGDCIHRSLRITMLFLHHFYHPQFIKQSLGLWNYPYTGKETTDSKCQQRSLRPRACTHLVTYFHHNYSRMPN